MEIPALIIDAGKDGVGEQPGLIRYEFDVAGQKLERVVKPCDDAAQGILRREAVAGGVNAVTFLYAEREEGAGTSVVWDRAWEGRTNNPVAVKVMWRGQQGDEIFEFERTVSLPGK